MLCNPLMYGCCPEVFLFPADLLCRHPVFLDPPAPDRVCTAAIRKLQAIGMMRADSCFDVRLPEEPNPPLSPCILGAEIRTSCSLRLMGLIGATTFLREAHRTKMHQNRLVGLSDIVPSFEHDTCPGLEETVRAANDSSWLPCSGQAPSARCCNSLGQRACS
jgi:hypothetical protein